MRIASIVSSLLLLAGALSASLGCDSDPDERTLIEGPRLLAVQSSPPALVGLDGSIDLRVLAIDGVGEELEGDGLRFRACSPWEFLIDPSRECLESEALVLSGTELTAQSLLNFYPPPPSLSEPTADPPIPPAGTCAPGAPIEVPIIAELMVEGVPLLTVKRVPVYLSEVVRRNPAIESIEVAAGLDGEHVLSIEMDKDSLDLECRDEVEVLEAVRVYLYSTSGSFESSSIDVVPTPAGVLDPVEVKWTSADAPALLFLVAVDNDGGVTWESLAL